MFRFLASLQSNSMVTSNTTLMLMDLDDIDDMIDFPRAPNVFWDPFDKMLRVDQKLSKVSVGDDLLTIVDSIKKTNSKRY